jgi:hypothetical protein
MPARAGGRLIRLYCHACPDQTRLEGGEILVWWTSLEIWQLMGQSDGRYADVTSSNGITQNMGSLQYALDMMQSVTMVPLTLKYILRA